jgi:hypothetical protein
MIGTVAVWTRPQDPAQLEPAQHGKVQIENEEIGRALVRKSGFLVRDAGLNLG